MVLTKDQVYEMVVAFNEWHEANELEARAELKQYHGVGLYVAVTDEDGTRHLKAEEFERLVQNL